LLRSMASVRWLSCASDRNVTIRTGRARGSCDSEGFRLLDRGSGQDADVHLGVAELLAHARALGQQQVRLGLRGCLDESSGRIGLVPVEAEVAV